LADPGRAAGYPFLGFGRRSIENWREARKTIAIATTYPMTKRRHSYSPAPGRNMGFPSAATVRCGWIEGHGEDGREAIPCHHCATLGSYPSCKSSDE